MSTEIKSSTPIKSSLIFRMTSATKKFRLQAEQSIQGVPFNTGSLSALSPCKRAVLKWNILCYAFYNSSVCMTQLPFSS